MLMSKLEVVYRRFFQFWLIFPNQNYQSRLKEHNFNWCWHRTLPLKKKRFSILENLLKTSGTTTKVLSCLKIPLISMRFIAKLWERRPQVPELANSSLPSPSPGLVSSSPWRNSSTATSKEFYFSFYCSEWLESKLTRAPLLGLANLYINSPYITWLRKERPLGAVPKSYRPRSTRDEFPSRVIIGTSAFVAPVVIMSSNLITKRMRFHFFQSKMAFRAKGHFNVFCENKLPVFNFRETLDAKKISFSDRGSRV